MDSEDHSSSSILWFCLSRGERYNAQQLPMKQFQLEKDARSKEAASDNDSAPRKHSQGAYYRHWRFRMLSLFNCEVSASYHTKKIKLIFPELKKRLNPRKEKNEFENKMKLRRIKWTGLIALSSHMLASQLFTITLL